MRHRRTAAPHSRRRSASAAAAARGSRTAARSPRSAIDTEAEVTMTRPSSTMPRTSAMVTASRCTPPPREPERAKPMSDAGLLMRPAPARPARTPRRGARSRGTCRGSRTPATAAPCRRGARPRRRRAPPPCSVAARASVQTPASARSISGGVAADEHRVAHLAAEGRGQRRKSWFLPSPPAITTSGPVHAGDRRERRADVGALGVVDVARRRRCRRPTASGAAGPGSSRSSSSIAAQRQAQRLAERQRRERVGGVVQARDLHARRAAAAARRGASATTARRAARRRSPRRWRRAARSSGCARRRAAWRPPAGHRD